MVEAMATRLTALQQGSPRTAVAFAAILLVATLAATVPEVQAAAPSIGSVSPSVGSTNGGTRVTVTGANFEDGALVEVGTTGELGSSLADDGRRARDVVVTSTSLSATLPPHAPGQVAMRVTNPNGESTTFTGVFTYQRPTSGIGFASVSPAASPAAGGAVITISGSNFDPNAERPTVFFGAEADNARGTVVAVTANSLSVITPAHAPGVLGILVRMPGDALDDNAVYEASCSSCFSFDPGTRPSVSSITPTSGTPAGGTPVTITGSNFVPGVQVIFSDSPPPGSATDFDATDDGEFADRVIYSSPTQITAVAPPASANAVRYVRVIHPAAVGADGFVSATGLTSLVSTATVIYSYTAAGGALSLAAVAPTSGHPAGGTLVTLAGNGFHQSAGSEPTVAIRSSDGPAGCGGALLANQPTADDVVVLTSSGLQVRMPAANSPASDSVVDFVVTNPGGPPVCLENSFAYRAPLEITGLSQLQGPAAGGALNDGTGTVTIFGNGFQSGAQVFFGLHRATDVGFSSSTTLTARPPPQAVGTVQVAVLNPDDRAALFIGYTYVSSAAPTLAKVEAVDETANSNGGQELLITGSNFQFSTDPDGEDGPLLARVPKVTVGGKPALVVTEFSGLRTSFTILAPMINNPLPTAGQKFGLTITNPDGKSVSSDDQSAESGGSPVTDIDYAVYDRAGKPEIVNVDYSGVNDPQGTANGGTALFLTGTAAVACGTLGCQVQPGTPAAPTNFFAPVHADDERKPAVSIGGTALSPDSVFPVLSGATAPFGFGTCTTGSGNCLVIITPPKTGTTEVSPNNKIKVTNPDGQSGESDADNNGDDFDYAAPATPNVVGFGGVTSGPTIGGTLTVITGTNFGPPTRDATGTACTATGADAPLIAGGFDGTTVSTPLPTVTFDGRAASVLCVATDKIHVLTPPNTAGPATVIVRSPNGREDTLAGTTFTYTAAEAPVLSNLGRLLTPIGGTTLNLVGENIGPSTLDAEGRGCSSGLFDRTEVVTPVPAVTLGGVALTDVCAVFDTNGATAGTPSTIRGVTARSPEPLPFPAPGFKTLQVINPDNLGASEGGKFRVLPFVPVPTSVTPATHSVNGGSAATARGRDFPTDAKPGILLDLDVAAAPQPGADVPAATVDATSATSAVFTVPRTNTPGTYDLKVVDPDGQVGTLDRAIATVAAPAPQLKAVSPAVGSINGGTQVLVEGSGFAGGADVVFGGLTITATTVSADGKRLTFVTPNLMEVPAPARDLGPVDILIVNPVADGAGAETSCTSNTVAAPSGNHCLTLLNRFSYTSVAGPAITGISPASGPAAGGTAVTISGTNFGSGASVLFDQAPATDVVVVNANTITAKTPAGTGAADVSVASNLQTATLANGFTYLGDTTSSSGTTTSGTTTSGTTTGTTTSGTTSGQTTTDGVPDPPTAQEIEDANNDIVLTVTRVGDTNVLEWDLPSAADLPATPSGLQVHFSNSPYTLLQTCADGSQCYESGTFTHTGEQARATTKYLVTLYYGSTAALGFFSGADAPDTDDYPGLASTDEQPDLGGGDGGLPLWVMALIVLGILFLVVLVAVLIARGRRDDDAPAQQQAYAWEGQGAAAPPIEAGGEVHQARCPACATSFTVNGSKPVITVCPGCGKKGILR